MRHARSTPRKIVFSHVRVFRRQRRYRGLSNPAPKDKAAKSSDPVTTRLKDELLCNGSRLEGRFGQFINQEHVSCPHAAQERP
jgi:hypothetical protein